MILGYSHPRLEKIEAERQALHEIGVSHFEMRITNIDKGSEIFGTSSIAKYLHGFGEDKDTLSLHSFPGINLGEKVERIREVAVEIVVDQLRFAESINAQWLTLHLGSCGFPTGHERKKSRLDLVIRSIEAMLRATKQHNVKIGIENLRLLSKHVPKCYLGDCLEDFVYLFERLGDERIGIVLDVGHMFLNVEAGQDALEAFIERFENLMLAVHVHANDGVKDLHEALTNSFFERYPPLKKVLSRLANNQIPLIAEHHNFSEAQDTLACLLQLKPITEPNGEQRFQKIG